MDIIRHSDRVRRGLGAAIALELAARRMTRRELSETAKLDDRQLARVLAGKSGLSIDSLCRVAAALGRHPADLLLVADPKPVRPRTTRGASHARPFP